MSNENPNNTSGWRNKLNELEHLPGSAFNTDAAWDKLHGRLQGNKKNKKTAWYWIAAACLLVGLMITILNYQKSIPWSTNKETTMDQSKKTNKPVLKVEKNDKNKNEIKDEKVRNAEPVKNHIAFISNKPIQKNRHIFYTERVTKVHDDIVLNYPQQDPIVKPLQIIKNNSTAAMTPPKKKLNVVHINELGDPVITSSDVTRIEDMHSFKFKFGNGEVFSNSPIASKPSGLITLKTKTASN